MTRSPGGRPPIDPARRRRQVKIYLETEELALLQGRAAECGVSVSAYLRQAALKDLPPQVPEINRTAFASLARINSNLNQFMAAINAGRAPEVELPDLHELYGLLLAVRHELMAGTRRPRRRRR
ncbi:MAG TPA: mobilization protein [Thermoanaerobaculia bacterium]|nr:mobilization protein [Thermoanaerobaculia bacterium]